MIEEPEQKHKLEGMFIPFNASANVPIFLTLNDGSRYRQFLLPLFSTKEKFDEAAKWGNFESARCKLIADSKNFLESVFAYRKNFSFHVVVDPYMTTEGNTRFQLLKLEEENS